MDLAIGAKDVYVMMSLFNKDGSAKLVASVHLPVDRPALRHPRLQRLRGPADPR